MIGETLQLSLAGGSVSAVLLLPAGEAPAPGAVLLHGYGSTKERLSGTIGRALARRGIASVAVDLPLHGDRSDVLAAEARRNPFALLEQWQLALAEARAAVHWLSGHDRLAGQRVALVGYSLGSYVAVITAAAEPLVRAVVVAAGGDLPNAPWASLLRRVADPVRAVRSLDGRPLLVLHGRADRTVTPDQAQRLYDAAGEPKELIWYDAGHVLPSLAAERAAGWLVDALGARGTA